MVKSVLRFKWLYAIHITSNIVVWPYDNKISKAKTVIWRSKCDLFRVFHLAKCYLT